MFPAVVDGSHESAEGRSDPEFKGREQLIQRRKCEHVFYNPETGEQWKDLWRGIKKACRQVGLTDVMWHTFRHAFASRLTRDGADVVTVKELLGHSSVSVMMRSLTRTAMPRSVRSD